MHQSQLSYGCNIFMSSKNVSLIGVKLESKQHDLGQLQGLISGQDTNNYLRKSTRRGKKLAMDLAYSWLPLEREEMMMVIFYLESQKPSTSPKQRLSRNLGVPHKLTI